jgi:leader peptidase (prepilin peptidase)/N-methyltransferase
VPAEDALVLVAAGLVGLAVGSFIAAAAWRLPRGMPVAVARSACPRCGHRLTPSELVPVLSWIVQRGRCRKCRAPVSAYYAIVESACALAAIIALLFARGWAVAAICAAAWGAIALAAWLWAWRQSSAALSGKPRP